MRPTIKYFNFEVSSPSSCFRNKNRKHAAGTDWSWITAPSHLRNASIILPPITDCPLWNGLVLSNALAQTRLYKEALEKSERRFPKEKAGGWGGGAAISEHNAIRGIYSDREMAENSFQLKENSENHWTTVMCGGGGGGEQDDREDTGGGVISVIRRGEPADSRVWLKAAAAVMGMWMVVQVFGQNGLQFLSSLYESQTDEKSDWTAAELLQFTPVSCEAAFNSCCWTDGPPGQIKLEL